MAMELQLTVKVGSSGAAEDSSTTSSACAMPASMAAETAAATALNFMIAQSLQTSWGQAR